MYFHQRFNDSSIDYNEIIEKILGSLNFSIDKNTTIGNIKLIDKELFQDDYYLICIGKNALAYSEAIEKEYFDTLIKSFVIQVKGYYGDISHLSSKHKIWWVDHPTPSIKNLDATNSIIKELLLLSANKKLIFIITGGTSAALMKPEIGLNLRIYVDIISHFLGNNYSIDELNQIRSVIDQTKGGKFLDLINSNNIYSIIISDVSSDDPRVVGSGPTIGGIPISDKVKSSLLDLGHQMHINVIISNLINLYEKNIMKRDLNTSKYQLISKNNFLKNLISKITENFLEYSVESIEFSSDYMIDDLVHYLDNQSNTVLTKKIIVGIGEILPNFEINKFGNSIGGRVSSMLLTILKNVLLPNNVSVYGFATDGKDGFSPDPGAYFHYKERNNLIQKMNNLNYNPILNSGKFFFDNQLTFQCEPTHLNFMDIIIIIWN